MRRLACVSFVLLSLLCLPHTLSAQEGAGGDSGRQESGFELEQNYPNPFNPETTVPFILHEDLFVDGRPVVVSMRILNILTQPVAVPVAKGHPAGSNVLLQQLEYTSPGRHEAFWDGRDSNGRQVASGLYYVQLTVNGVRKHLKIYVTK